MDCHFLLQGIFLTQGSNPCLLHCMRILYSWATREVLLCWWWFPKLSLSQPVIYSAYTYGTLLAWVYLSIPLISLIPRFSLPTTYRTCLFGERWLRLPPTCVEWVCLCVCVFLSCVKLNSGAFLVAQMVKNPPANAVNWSLIPRSGRSPGEGNDNPLQYSCMASLVA